LGREDQLKVPLDGMSQKFVELLREEDTRNQIVGIGHHLERLLWLVSHRYPRLIHRSSSCRKVSRGR